VTLDFEGGGKVELAVGAHYLDVDRTPELEALAALLPPSARGDWHWFSSVHSRWTL